jgi:hypothetical protein
MNPQKKKGRVWRRYCHQFVTLTGVRKCFILNDLRPILSNYHAFHPAAPCLTTICVEGEGTSPFAFPSPPFRVHANGHLPL